MSEHNKPLNLISGSLWENIWRMSWPMLLVMIFQFLVGLADIYVAGFLGPDIQAIVGFVSQLYFLIVIIANALSIGTVALFSRAIGSGRQEEAVHIARQSLVFGFFCGLVIAFAGLFFHDQIVRIAGFPPEIRDTASDFIIIYSLALAPNYVVIIANAVFRAGGEVKLTLFSMFFISLVNIVLNFVLVRGLFSFPAIGYRGIAVSTAIAMGIGMVISMALFRRSSSRQIFAGRWSVSSGMVMKIFRISWPAALLQLSWSAGSIILYNILGRLEAGNVYAMAALTNGLRIEAIIYLPAFALHMAASVLIGQNLGAKDPERAEQIGWRITRAGVVFVSTLSLPIFIWPEVFASPVARHPEVLWETARYLRMNMLSEPFMALSAILGGCLQGAGDTKGTMLIIVTAMWIIRLPFAWFLGIEAGFGAAGVWTAMVVSMIFQGILMTARFRNGKWKGLKIPD